MSKRTLLWLWLAILTVFIIFCIKSKINDFIPKESELKAPAVEKVVNSDKLKLDKKTVEHTIKKTPVKEAAEIEPEQPPKQEPKQVKKDINFKIDKSGDELSISGVLNAESDFINLASKYKGLKNRDVKYEKEAKNPQIFDLALNLSEVMDRLKSGYLEYQNGNLIVDGVVASKEDKELIDSTLNSIKDIKVSSNIVVEEPKSNIEHVGKLSITKQGDIITISGIFSSEKEIDELVELLKSKNMNVKKELCVVDSDLKEDRWKVPFVVVMDDFLEFTKGTIQFDKDTFSIIGETDKKGLKEDVKDRLASVDSDVKVNSDITYNKPKPTKKEIQEKINSILKLKSVRFIRATGILLKESKPILDEVAQILLQNPNIKVEIAGHTDSDGDAKTNLILSQYRADTVRKYLIKKGVKAENLKAIGYGEGKPLVKNDSEKNKQINRRVEFIILGD